MTASHTPATLDHTGIAARVPHAGCMCLLHALLDWSEQHVLCSAISHSDPGNPLRTAGGLLSPNAIEYASQAMALHASLCAADGAEDGAEDGAKDGASPGTASGTAARAGYLASARSVHLHVPRLDTAPGPLHVRVQRVMGDARQAIYRFTLHDADSRLLVEGRATVVLDGVPQ